jgi:hypothetical protein
MAGLELATAFVTMVPDTSRIAPGVSQALGQTSNQAGQAGQESGKKFSDKFGDAAKKGAIAAGALVSGLLAKGIVDALDFGGIQSKLTASLEVSPQKAAELGASAGNVFKGAYAASMGEASDAIGIFAGTFKTLDAAAVESATKIGLSFSQIFGADLNESVLAAQNLISEGMATDVTQAFDLMTVAAKKLGPTMAGEIPATIDAYGAAFESMGFNGAQAFSFIVENGQKGIEVLDHAGDSVKEFGIRMSEMDKNADTALSTIGVNIGDMAAAVAEGGPRAQEALQQVIAKLKEVPDGTEQARLAMEIFGDPLRELGANNVPAFINSLDGGTEALGEFAGAGQKASDELGDNMAGKFQSLKNTIQVGVVESLIKAADWMTQNKEITIGLVAVIGTFVTALGVAKVAAAGFAIAQGVSAAATGAGTAAFASNTIAMGAYAVASGVMRVATLAGAAAQWLLNAALTANPIGIVVVAIAALVAGLVWFFTKTELGRQIWETVWNAIKATLSAVWDFIKGVWDAMVATLAWVGDKIGAFGAAVGAVWQGVQDGIAAAVQWVMDKWNSVVEFVTGLPAKLSAAARGMWDGIKEAFKSAINWIIKAWNAIEFKIPGFELGPVKFDGFTLGLPDIPMLADGGVAGRRQNGRLWGPGTGTSDSILGVDKWGMPTALVSAREGVVKERAMDAGGDRVVAALNAGWVPSVSFLEAMLPGYKDGTPYADLYPDKRPKNRYQEMYPDSRAPKPSDAPPPPPPTGKVLGPYAIPPTPQRAQGPAGPNGYPTVNVAPPAAKEPPQSSTPAPASSSGGDGELGGGTVNASIWDVVRAKFPDATLNSGYRAGDPGFHGIKKAIDVGGPMQQIADYMFGNYKADLAQIIWNNGPVLYNVRKNELGTGVATAEGAEARGIYGETTMGQHADHVHLAAEDAIGPKGGVTPDVSTNSSTSSLTTSAPSASSPSTSASDDVSPMQKRNQELADSISQNFGNAASAFVSGQVSDILGVFGLPDSPSWLKAANEFQKSSADFEQLKSDQAAYEKGQGQAPGAGPSESTKPSGLAGAAGYSFDITKAAKDLNFEKAGAIIGNAVALVESEMKMYANSSVPESLNFPHDAVGSDHDSVGLFQQRPSWGSVADRMNAGVSAGLFFKALAGVPNWQSMDPGAAAQAVQRSAFPDKYGKRMAEAVKLVDGANLYDQGGWIQPGLQLVANKTGKPEPVLNRAQWAQFSELADTATQQGPSGPRVQITNHLAVSDERSQMRKLKMQNEMALMQYGGAL